MLEQVYEIPAVDAIRQARKKRMVAVMLVVYGDESHDEKQQHIFTVAVLVGTQEQWDLLESFWRCVTHNKDFHAADCESGYESYKDIPKNERHNEYKNLTQLLAISNIKGLGLAMDLAAYRNYNPNAHDNGPYIRCFSRCIAAIGKLATSANNTEPIKFIFDNNCKTEYNAGLLYHIMLNSPDCAPYIKCMNDEIGFATRKTVGIQAADLWAREVMKYCENRFIENNKRPIRKSMQALMDSKNFIVEYQNNEYFQDMVGQFNDGRLESLTGMKLNDYAIWRDAKNLTDNETNRLKYLAHIDLCKTKTSTS